MAEYDDFYRRLIAEVPLKNVTSRFAMERVKTTTAYPPANERSAGAGSSHVADAADKRKRPPVARPGAEGDRFNLGRPQR